MAGNGTIGLELVRGPRGLRHRDRPVGRRRAHDRDRERGEGAAPGRARRHRGAGDGGAARGRAGRRRAGADRVSAVVRRRRRRPRAAADDVGPRAAGSSTRRSPFRSTRSPRRSALLASRARVVAEGAGALALAAARRREGTVVCIVSGGNIDAAVLARILAGEHSCRVSTRLRATAVRRAASAEACELRDEARRPRRPCCSG